MEIILKMQQFYKEYEGKAIIPSHHQMPAKSDIFERYISLCNDILSGKLTGKYEDQGLCDGKVVKGYKLQMVYRKIKKEQAELCEKTRCCVWAEQYYGSCLFSSLSGA